MKKDAKATKAGYEVKDVSVDAISIEVDGSTYAVKMTTEVVENLLRRGVMRQLDAAKAGSKTPKERTAALKKEAQKLKNGEVGKGSFSEEKTLSLLSHMELDELKEYNMENVPAKSRLKVAKAVKDRLIELLAEAALRE